MFLETAVQGRDASTVAEEINVSRWAVCKARARVCSLRWPDANKKSKASVQCPRCVGVSATLAPPRTTMIALERRFFDPAELHEVLRGRLESKDFEVALSHLE